MIGTAVASLLLAFLGTAFSCIGLAFLGYRRSTPQRLVSWIGVVGPSCVTVAGLTLLYGLDGTASLSAGTWIELGDLAVGWKLRVGRLTALLFVAMGLVAATLKVSMTALEKDRPGYARRSALLDAQLLAAAALFVADDLVLAAGAITALGLLSHLLSTRVDDQGAQTPVPLKSFMVQRVGDAFFLVGAALLIRCAKVSDLAGLEIFATQRVEELRVGIGFLGISKATAIALCFSIALGIKGALFPLPNWVDEEGEESLLSLGLTQTLATIGSAVFLLCRLDFVFEASPTARIALTAAGAATALAAATVAMAQWRVDRILTYSSVSQIGFAMVAAGLGQKAVALTLLGVHAFAKTGLIIAMAAVVRSLAGDRDLRRMGGMSKRMPLTFLLTILCGASIAGLPPSAGFFAQVDVLRVAGTSRLGHGWFLWVLLMLAAFCTAIYIGRLIILVFSGSSRAPESVKDQIRESPRAVLMSLGLLAGVSTSFGLWELPSAYEGKRWLRAAFEQAVGSTSVVARGGDAVEASFLILSVMVGVAGIFVAFRFFLKDPEVGDQLALRHRDLFRLWRDRYRLDALYASNVRDPILSLAEKGFVRTLDRRVAEALFDRTAAILHWLGSRLASLRAEAARIYFAVAIGGLLLILFSILT